MDEFLFTQHGSAEDAALTVELFGGRVYDEIGSEINGCLTDGGSETVIYVKEDVVLFAERAGGSQIDDVEARIGGRFDKEHLCVGLDGGFPGCGIAGRNIRKLDTVFGKVFSDHGVGAAEDGIADQEMVAFFEKGEK